MSQDLIHVSKTITGRINQIIMPRTSNWHAHLRAGPMMEAVAGVIMRPHKYVLVMPNTGPIKTIGDVRRYHAQLIEIRDRLGFDTELIMTLYFTNLLTPRVIEQLAALDDFRCEVKYYPPEQGATTGSGHGIPLSEWGDTLRAMAECGIPLLGHFESVFDRSGKELPHAQREGYFLSEHYFSFRDEHRSLDVCIEHASTAIAVEVVKADTSGHTTMTVTPHHLLFTMEELMDKSWRNHGRCMPYLKTADDRAALQEFVFSGDRRAIAGDDTAPHPSKAKVGAFEEASCGCWLPHAIGLYIMAAHQADALNDDFVHFMCYNGADWRGLRRPEKDDGICVVACKSTEDIPDPVEILGQNDVVIPLGWTEEADRLRIGHTLLKDMHCSH